MRTLVRLQFLAAAERFAALITFLVTVAMSLVDLQINVRVKSAATFVAEKVFLSGVTHSVDRQLVFSGEFLIADIAGEFFMGHLVVFEQTRFGERLVAQITLILFFLDLVTLPVLVQTGRCGANLVTNIANVVRVVGVTALMGLQFPATSKGLAAHFTGKIILTMARPLVVLQFKI
jgi:hypothetical protein